MAGLARQLKRLLRGIRFDRIRDFGPEEGVFPEGGAQPLSQRPYLDLAVIALDRLGCRQRGLAALGSTTLGCSPGR